MKAKAAKVAPYVLLGLAFLMLFVLNICYQDHWLDSDMAAEMIFSKLLAQEHHIFATPDWYYSTEFRFLYTQLVMGPLFLLLGNWHVIRTITNLIFYGLMLASYFYFMKPLKVSKTISVYGALLLLLPFSETMMTHMQMGNTYLSHVIICFLFFGMFLRLAENSVENKTKRFLLLLCFLALAVICGVSGVRYLLALQCPLFITAVFYLLRADELKEFRRESSLKEVLNIAKWKRVLHCGAASYLYYAVVSAVASVAGYGINVLYVSKRYVFQTYDATNFIAIYQGELFERIQNAIGCLLMLFGYIPEKGFLSLRGIISMMAFVMLAMLIFCTVKAYRKENEKRFFVALFVIVAFVLNFFVFSFTTSTMVPRYYITIWMFTLPLLVFYLESREPALDKFVVVLVLAACLTLGTAKTVISFISVDKNESKRPVAEFLADNGYHFGFASYTNANMITELTNGEVEIANVNNPESLTYFKWSTPKKYYEEGYHQGKVFLLLTVEEYAEYSDAKALSEGNIIYEDDAYVVFIYDNVKTLIDHSEMYQ